MEGKTLLSKQVVLASYANEGPVTDQHIKVVEKELDVSSVANGDADAVLAKTLLVSIDPYLRFCMKEKPDAFPPFQLNQPIIAVCLSRIVESASGDFKVGDIVMSHSDVSEYAVLPVSMLRKIKVNDILSLPEYLYLSGPAGFSSWVGLVILSDPKPGEQVFISAAAGAVGLLAGQLAKLKGCRVVGSTGSDEKVRMLKEEYGFDDAFNYKSEVDWDEALARYFPNGIDIYFENVGGRMLESVLNHVNMNARIPVCGMISEYNQDYNKSYGVRNLFKLMGKCVKMQGFLCGNYLDHMENFIEEIIGYRRDEKIELKIYTKHGIDKFLDGFNAMFNGGNVGKTLLQLSEY